MSKTRTVDVPLTSTAGGVLKVPPFAASKDDQVRWRTGGRTVSIWFPKEGVLDFPNGRPERQKDDITAHVPLDAAPGVYRYVIYCHDTDEFVECNSHPIIVIPGP